MKKRGFTLVEVIVTATLVAVVAAAIASLFSSGVRLWNRARQASMYQNVVLLELEGVCRQFRQTVNSRRSAFAGNSNAVTFMVWGKDGMSECRYEFDATGKKLSHKQRTLSQVIEDTMSVQELQPAIEGIDALEFAYGSVDTASGSWKWEQGWTAAKPLPLAIRLAVTKDNQTLVKTVFIPVAAREKTLPSIVKEGE